jgi:DNA topoisomerase IB
MTGRKNDHALTREDAENLDPKRKKQLARYRQVRKKVLEHYKALVRQLVRENNGKPITITRLLKELDKSNIEVHSVPDGFEGKIDEQGRLYTHDEKRLNNPPTPGSKIEMNPNYDESVSGQGWYAKFWPPGAEKPQQSYTVDWKHKKTEVRDAQVDHLTDKVTSARKRWIADLNDDDKEVWSKGLMLELLYTYAMRIGTPGNQTDGEKTFGLTTLLAKHVTFQSGGKARIAFKGKSGVKQAYLIRPMDKISRLVIQRLQELVKGKQPSDHLFRVGTRNLTPADANIYIRKKGLNVTAKAFRRLKGKILMEGYLATKKIKKDATQKEAEDYLKRGALEVGKALGHKRGESEEFTPATALKSYIPPHIMLKFFADRGLRVPKWLQQHEKE